MTIDFFDESKMNQGPETFSGPELKVVAPKSNSVWKIRFTSENPAEIEAYNYAVGNVLKLDTLPTTPGKEEELNCYSWEIHTQTDQEELESLVPQMHKLAQDFLSKNLKNAA
jgi:hypothetical protein